MAVSDRVTRVRLDKLRPAELDDAVYRPVDPADPAIVELARSIRGKGLIHPLVVTTDGVIVSGHRRWAACRVAGLETVRVQRLNIPSADPRFPGYLVEANQQRVKTPEEMIREEVVRTSPEEAHEELLAHREAESVAAHLRAEAAGLRILETGLSRARSAVSEAKRGMLDAAVAVLTKYRDHWPLTLRQVHYRLLTRDVLRNAKTGLRYVNSQQSYKDLSDLLSRARLSGLVPWESMHDPTRPRTEWRQWDDVGSYVRGQLDGFLRGYKRNLLVSQPAYVELVCEKLTVHEIADRAAGPFHVPVGVGRGYTSVTSLEETAARFHASGKDRFVLLIAGDLDPEGESICDTWGACLEDEHGVDDLTVVKVGVNPNHVAEYGLQPLPVKESSSRAAGFAAAHGTSVYELEAFEPDHLQALIRGAILGVLDLDRFEQERRREAEDARVIRAYRRQVEETFKSLRVEDVSGGERGAG